MGASMKKVLVDVGAHTGETLSVAMQEKWGFDQIYSFEPASPCWPSLDRMADDRVKILRFGLWSQDAQMILHDPGSIGASVHQSKAARPNSLLAEFKDAAKWFDDNIDPSDEVVVKLNCEGAECEILDRLLEAGHLENVSELLIHFDVRKVPGQEFREAETRHALDRAGVRYRSAETIFFGRNTQEKTANWLAWYNAKGVRKLRYSLVRRVEFAIRRPAYRLRKWSGL